MSMLMPAGMWQSPPGRPALNLNHSLIRGVTDVWVPKSAKTLLRNDAVAVTSGTVSLAGRDRGMAAVFASTGANRLAINQMAANLVFPNGSDCTVFIIRRSVDTTPRASALYGFNLATNNRICMFAPFSDGNFYWDCGGTASNQRLSVAFTKSTSKESIVCIAGGGKGREIWRNGVKIASDSTKTGTFSPTAADIYVGGNFTDACDTDEVYMVGVLARAWSDAEVVQWTRNPWQIFMGASQKPLTDLSAGSPGVAGTARGGFFITF